MKSREVRAVTTAMATAALLLAGCNGAEETAPTPSPRGSERSDWSTACVDVERPPTTAAAGEESTLGVTLVVTPNPAPVDEQPVHAVLHNEGDGAVLMGPPYTLECWDGAGWLALPPAPFPMLAQTLEPDTRSERQPIWVYRERNATGPLPAGWFRITKTVAPPEEAADAHPVKTVFELRDS